MKILRSFTYAFNGLKICFSSETNFQIHIVFAVLAIIFGFLLNISNADWLLIIGCIVFVITMEMVNTAIEKLCDLVHKSFHPVIKRIKDITAGAVLVSATGSFIVGCIVFLPKIIVYIKSL